MSGEEAAIRVDGVSGATKNHSPLVSYGTLALPDAKLLFSALRRHTWQFLDSLLAYHTWTATFKASPSETRPQGLQASVAASLVSGSAERER